MSPGRSLAEARRQAGLSVTQVSEQTRIREAIIRGIERDDYSSCGGSFYARGHIRAMARAVGTDPVPLIEEFDAAEADEPAAEALPEHAAHRASGDRGAHRAPSDPGPAHWVPSVFGEAGEAPGEITDPNAVWPAIRPGITRRQRLTRAAVIAVALLAAIGALAYLLASCSGAAPHASTAAGRAAHPRARGRPHPAPAPSPSTVGATPAARGAPAQTLHPVSAAAFGPGGTGQGDNPQFASLAIDGNSSTAWETDWYSTSHFGNVQTGTGLLLDMGRPVTVTSAQITLGSNPGADLQLRAGSSAALGHLRTVARAAGAAGVLRLRLARPARARYVLIWFTQLPRDPAGTYQAKVYNVRLQGTG